MREETGGTRRVTPAEVVAVRFGTVPSMSVTRTPQNSGPRCGDCPQTE